MPFGASKPENGAQDGWPQSAQPLHMADIPPIWYLVLLFVLLIQQR